MLFELEGYEDDLDYRSIPLSSKTPCSEAVGIIVKKFDLPGNASEYYLVEVSEENEGGVFFFFYFVKKILFLLASCTDGNLCYKMSDQSAFLCDVHSCLSIEHNPKKCLY